MEHRWNVAVRRQQTNSEINQTLFCLTTLNHTWAGLKSKSGLLCEKPTLFVGGTSEPLLWSSYLLGNNNSCSMKANFLLQKITLTNRLFHISRDIHISYNVTISGGQDQMSEGVWPARPALTATLQVATKSCIADVLKAM